jgi:hypothetical protein
MTLEATSGKCSGSVDQSNPASGTYSILYDRRENQGGLNHAANALCSLVQLTGTDKGKGPLYTS